MQQVLFYFVLFATAFVSSFAQELVSIRCSCNETYNDCASPCAVEPTCPGLTSVTPLELEKLCIDRCDQKCECKPGYVRIEPKGKCIKTEDCPNRCSSNETYTECASPCGVEPTCQNLSPISPPNQACILSCDQKCHCKPGYVRIEPNGRCIKINDCPKRCGCNEFYNPCASPCTIQPTCEIKYPASNTTCIKKCDPRCECNSGYIRIAPNGTCVKIGECICGPNQVKGCRPCCGEETCQNRDQVCKKICPVDLCISECVCKKGYVLENINGKCIPLDKCPKRLIG